MAHPLALRLQHRAWPVLQGLVTLVLVASTAGAQPLKLRAVEPATDDPASYDLPGEIVVDAQDNLSESALAELFASFGLHYEATATEHETHAFVVDLARADVASMTARLSADARVEYVEPVSKVHALFVPNDPLFATSQWHLSRVGAQKAWDFATGRGVTVAVVDTGIACDSRPPFTKASDLATTTCVLGLNALNGTDQANDDNGHGTHVAGTIAQSTNNGVGAAGMAFDARLMPIKVLSAGGWGTTVGVADGIRWAADHGASVINLSLGGPRSSKLLQRAIDHAVRQGSVVVAAAGNTGGAVSYPAACDGVIAVSATDENDAIAGFSSRGESVDLAAPGVNVVQQTICNGGKDGCEVFPSYRGTSMATPHVAGAAALVMSLGVTEPSAVEAALKRSARSVDSSDEGRRRYGAGLLQAGDTTERITLVQLVTRLFASLLCAALVLRSVGKTGRATIGRFGSITFWLGMLATGPGLLCFLPWLTSRVHGVVNVLSRPVADLDLYLGVAVHAWLPLASAALPVGLAAIGLGIRSLRSAIAGFAVGASGYLLATIALGEMAAPLGRPLLVGWCAANALVCAWVARASLVEKPLAASPQKNDKRCF